MRVVLILVFLSFSVNGFSQAPPSFSFTATNSSGKFYGQAQIDGLSADENDWVAAFDEAGVCAGASQIIEANGQAYIDLTIYGDDATTTAIDEGISNNESFTLMIYDSSENEYYAYESTQNTILFDNWSNTNGAPIPAYNNPNEIYNFIVFSTVSLNLVDTIYCSNEVSFNFEGGEPLGGSYYIDNILADLLLSSQVSAGYYEVVYVYNDQSASQEIYIVSNPQISIASLEESVVVSFDSVLNVDQYRFRYREVGGSSWSEVSLGDIDGEATIATSLTISNLIGCTDYEIQVKLNSIDFCETEWSSSTVFTLDYFTSTTISGCDSLLIEGEYIYQSGVYTYQYEGVNQCDSVLEYNLTINNSYSDPTEVITACDSYFWNGQDYNQSGVYFFNELTSAGCDSTATLELTILNSSSSSLTETACDSYFWNGQDYNQSGVYSFTTQNSNGCDSVSILNLTVYNTSSSTENVVACNDYFWNGETYLQSGTYTFTGTNSLGCDSVATLNLTISNSSTTSEVVTACDSYFWNGETYSNSGIYSYETTNNAGCDSTIYLILTVNSSYSSVETVSACGSYFWKGELYNQSGIYQDEQISSNGCDSTSTLNLTINQATSSFEQTTSCFSYEWNGQVYTESGTYTFETVNSNGCDSIATLSLTVISSSSTTETLSSCNEFTWDNGVTYSESNNSDFYIVYGPDSLCGDTIYLDLTIQSPTFNIDNQVHCQSYTWIDGITYTSSNNSATHILTNNAGCDSIVTLNLTILSPTSGTDTQVHCDEYTWMNGITYTESNNTATHILTNNAGCDSIVTLNLTILNSTSGIDTQTHCESYTWIDGITYTESNNTATHILTNSAGCDSVVTLDLTILNPSSSVDTQLHCDSYTWINGVTYSESNNTDFHILTNSVGCDSVVSLDLTISNSTSGIDEQTHCGSYTWINGITYTESNNTATQVFTNSEGCDSLVVLNLTIVDTSLVVDSQSHCDSYTWIDGITYTESNNTATQVFTNSAGCDSTVLLDLTILNSYTEVDTQIQCDSYTWVDGNTYTESNNTAVFVSNYLDKWNVANGDASNWIPFGTNLVSEDGDAVKITGDGSSSLGARILLNESNLIESLILNKNYVLSAKVKASDAVFISVNDGVNANNNSGVLIESNQYVSVSIPFVANSETNAYLYLSAFSSNETSHIKDVSIVEVNEFGQVFACDTTLFLDLTIINSSNQIDSQTHCDSYTWIDGVTYTQSNNTATQVLTNSVGCDSVVTLDLTILNSHIETDTQTHCDSYTWIDGVTYTESNSSATFVSSYQEKWNTPNGDANNWLPFGTNIISQEDDAVKITGNGSSTLGARVIFNQDNLAESLVLNSNYVVSAKVKTSGAINISVNDGVSPNNASAVSVISSDYESVSIPFVAYSETNAYLYLSGFSNNETAHIKDISIIEVDENGQILSCDTTVILDLTILNSTIGTDTQVHCDEYTWMDGITYTESNNSATHILTNSLGCDSIVTLNLTILNSTSGIDTQTHCDSYTWIDGNTYTESNTSATFVLSNSAGCDSIVTLDLTILNSTSGIDTQTHCDSYTWIDGNTYTESNNTAAFVLTNSLGCDSIVSLDLTILNSTSGIDTQTHCDNYLWIDGNTYTESNNTATHVITNSLGCDSVVTLNLTILNSSAGVGVDNQTDCYDYTWVDGNTYTASNNTATFTYTNSVGCDSVVTLNLIISESSNSVDTQVHCDSFTWLDGITYTESNNTATFVSYQHEKWNTQNGDTTNWLTFGTNIIEQDNDAVKITGDGSSIFGGRILLNDNSLIDNLTVGQNYLLSAKVKTSSSVGLIVNDGLNTNANLAVVVESQDYSIVSFPFVAYSETSAFLYLSLFSENETAHIKDISLIEVDESGTFISCDSVITLDLTILNSTSGTDSQIHCDSYTWIDGITYTESNDTATFVLTNSVGCDSLVTLDLTILNSTSGTDSQIHCDSYTWIDGITYTESNDSATFVLFNSIGCDSIVSLNLTIYNSDTITEVESACDSFEWNGQIYTESGLYEYSDLTVNGCDSIVFLDLTVNYSDTLVSDVIACGSYEWNGITHLESGTYVYDTINESGCPQAYVINLTISNMVFSYETENYNGYGVSCFGSSDGSVEVSVNGGIEPYQYQWSNGSDNQNINGLVSGSYTVLVTDSNNCVDSLIVELSQPDPLFIDTITSNFNGFGVSCYDESDGFIEVSVMGGVGPYIYQWSNGSNNASIDNLVSDSYTVLITDSNSCADSLIVELSQPEPLFIDTITSNFNGFGVSCYGESDGFIEVSVTGGAGSYAYEWSNGLTDTFNDGLSSGTYVVEVSDENGCQDMLSIDVLEPDFIVTHDTISNCLSYEWNGEIYTESGDYEFLTTSEEGCDSLVMLNLTINLSDTTSSNISSCELFTWNDSTYFESGTYSYTYSNINGCDSVHTIHLTILEPSYGTDVQVHCEQFIWIDGNTYTSSTNFATYTLTNSLGCDSTVTLHLTILGSTMSDTAVTVCDSYFWNGNTYNTSGLYSANFINSNGCDSTAYLDLTIPAFEPFQIVGPNNVVGGSSANYSLNTALYDLQWSISEHGQIISGQGSDAIFVEWDNVNASAELCVYAIDEFNCESDISCVDIDIDRLSSIKEFGYDGISIYPNPFTTKTLIDFSNCKYEITNVELYDIHGKLVYSSAVENNKQFELVNNNLDNNMYLLRLFGPNHNSYHKLLTQ